MKTTLLKWLTIAGIFCFSIKPVHAQTAVKLVNGTYQAIKDSTGHAGAKPFGKSFTASDGTICPIYVSAKGKFFIVRTSKKTGNQYRQYLNLQ